MPEDLHDTDTNDALENAIRGIVEAHDSLCLDVEADRDTLIGALYLELSGL